jgi:transposase InsO family protein
VLCTYNGGEFTAAEFAYFCADEGIQRHFSAPYSSQQNGVVECGNQTVVATARALFTTKAERNAGHVLGRGSSSAQSLTD